jgi:HK97 family phage prohead protease
MRPDLRYLTPSVRSRLELRGVDLDSPLRGINVRCDDGQIREARSTDNMETREGKDGRLRLVGYASTYNQRYDIGPQDDWGWSEIISRGAAARSIKNKDDVFLLYNHDGLPLARTADGTLTLEDHNRGLWSDGDIDPESPFSMEVYRRVQKGQLDRMSFAFEVVNERWEDRDGNETDWRVAPVRRILEVKLHDTSVVNYPANPYTSVNTNAAEPSGMSLAEAKRVMASGMSLDDARSAFAAI